MAVEELKPGDVQRWLAERSIVLIDVREPHEYAAERIHGAFLYPLSTFDPKSLPIMRQRRIVLHCGTGKRSERAVAMCEMEGVDVHSHMKGGLAAWKQAGLATMLLDPDTGSTRDVV